MIQVDRPLVFVTGASAGIGEATARAFAARGARLLLAARRMDRLRELAAELRREYQTETTTLELDVRDSAAVSSAVESLPSEWAAIDVLINNAGLSRGLDKAQTGDLDDWDEMIDTNLKGLLYVTRAVLPGMVARGRGDVVLLGSIAGHEVYPAGNVYCATKHAVRALAGALRLDLNGTGVRVSTIDPGMVETEFSVVRFRGDADRAARVYGGLTPLSADDVADSIVWAVSRPGHVNVAEILLLPTDQASATVVHRRPTSLRP